MSGATDLERLVGYARTFELAVLADAWTALEPWFADGARHRVHAAAPLGEQTPWIITGTLFALLLAVWLARLAL